MLVARQADAIKCAPGHWSKKDGSRYQTHDARLLPAEEMLGPGGEVVRELAALAGGAVVDGVLIPLVGSNLLGNEDVASTASAGVLSAGASPSRNTVSGVSAEVLVSVLLVMG